MSNIVIVVRHPDWDNQVFASDGIEVHTFDLGAGFDITRGAPEDREQFDDAKAMRRAAERILLQHPEASEILENLIDALNEFMGYLDPVGPVRE